VSGSGIRWAICKSAHRSRQITMPATHHSVFYRRDALPAAQPTVSKHCQSTNTKCNQNQMRVPHHHTDCHWQSVPKAVLNTSDHWRRTTMVVSDWLRMTKVSRLKQSSILFLSCNHCSRKWHSLTIKTKPLLITEAACQWLSLTGKE